MPRKKLNLDSVNIFGLKTPVPLPPPDKNMYKRKENKELPLPARLPAPLLPQFKTYSAKKTSSLPSTYNYDNVYPSPNYSNSGMLTREIFPTANSITTFKTQERPLAKSPLLSPLSSLPKFTVLRKKNFTKRCPKGHRRNKKTKLCEKNKYYMRKLFTKRNHKRCPNGKRRNPITLNCESKTLFTRYRI